MEVELFNTVLLEDLITSFYQDKELLEKYKKSTTKYNEEIKQQLAKADLDKFETSEGLIAKISTQKRESFNEEKLIQRLKELKITTPIKTVEVIDYEELENVIYNNELDATKITDCKQVKEVTTLRVSKKKGGK